MTFSIGDEVIVSHPATIDGDASAVFFGKEVRGTIQALYSGDAFVVTEDAGADIRGQSVDLECLRPVPENLPIIDIDMARDLLLKAVATQGRAFQYNDTGDPWTTCRYAPMAGIGGNREKTGCIVGVALGIHGETRHYSNPGSAYSLQHEMPGLMTDEAMRYFSEAQTYQDRGDTWGQAFDAAEALYQRGGHLEPSNEEDEGF